MFTYRLIIVVTTLAFAATLASVTWSATRSHAARAAESPTCGAACQLGADVTLAEATATPTPLTPAPHGPQQAPPPLMRAPDDACPPVSPSPAGAKGAPFAFETPRRGTPFGANPPAFDIPAAPPLLAPEVTATAASRPCPSPTPAPPLPPDRTPIAGESASVVQVPNVVPNVADGSLSGAVTDASATPIAGASVWVISGATGIWIGPVTTAADGTYLMPGLAPGCYFVYVSAPGYPGQYYDGTYDYYAAALVCVSAGSDTPNIDFALATSGAISGTVTDALGTPIAGASVEVIGWGSATTAPDGTYLVDSLPPGSYEVRASAPGYAGEYFNNTYSSDAATPVSVASGVTTPNIDFALAVGGKISGTVTDALGTPIAGASVYASSDGWCCGGGWATTAADGTYVIDTLATGSYYLRASAPGYPSQYYDGTYDWDARTTVSATSGLTTPNIDFALPLGGAISGTVTNALSSPIAGAYVYACPAGGGSCPAALTAPDGTYLINGLGPSNYSVHASAAGYAGEYFDNTYSSDAATPVSVASGVTTPNIDFALAVGGKISGTVTNALGTPIAGASVYANSDGWCCGDGSATTAADGTYLIDTLATGSYYLQASAPGYPWQYYDGTYDWSARTTVSATSGLTTPNIDFALQQGGRISGTVTNDLGTPIAGASVGAGRDSCCSSRWTTTAADGTYLVDALAPGNYRVVASAAGYAGEYYNDVYDYYDAALITVSSGAETTGIDFVLAPAARISGTVTNALGTPIAGASISAYADGCGYCGDGYATSAPDGTYVIGTLVPGNYRVRASATGYAAQYYNGTFDSNAATLVSATSGIETTGINFALPPGGRISGTVANSLGTPIAGASVSASQDGGSGWGYTYTAGDGTYLINSLVPGNYRLQASAAGYVEEYYNNTYDYYDATLVATASGTETTGIDFALDPAARVSGTVTNALGTPIAGAQVSASTDACCGWGFTTTSSDGTYTVDGLAPGNYRVRASASGYAWQYYNGVYAASSATLVTATSGVTTPNIDFALVVEGTISGTVTNALGTPIAGAWVSASDDTCCNGNWAFSAIDGTYTIKNLAPGNYRVDAIAGGYARQYWDHVPDAPSATLVPVSSGAETTGIDFALVPPDPDNSSTPKFITSFPFIDSRNTTGAALEGGEPHTCGNMGATIWYQITAPISPPGTSSVAIDTAGSDFNTAIAIYTLDPAVPSPPGALLQLACSPNWGHNSELTFTAEPGTTYYIQVGGQDGATGNLIVHADGDADTDLLRDSVETNTGVYVDTNNTGTNPAATDTDDDGCRDGAEVLHWGLNPLVKWDFYSVPVPALFVAPHPDKTFRDATVSAGDAQAVFGYFKVAAKTGTTEYEQDLNLNGIKDGVEYDRSVIVGSPGASGPPNGTISAADAQLAFAQFKRAYKC